MSPSRYAHLVAFALDHDWALTPSMLRVVAGLLGERLAGRSPDAATVAAAIAARKPDLPQPARGGIAVIPMYGVLAPRANMFTEASGGTSFEKLTGYLRDAVARADVDTIVFDVDSPGGSVAGATEFAAVLRSARTKKPVIAVANHQMASAAYWVMSNATKIYASPSSQLGSVGVYTIHDDLSAALEKFGVKRTYIAAGKYKAEGNETEALSIQAHAHLTARVAQTYDRFLTDVAKGRGVPITSVRAGYGEGRLVGAEDALALGMADKILTLDETLERLLPAGATLASAVSACSTLDTPQEPFAATGQDRTSDALWQSHIACELLALQLL